MFCEQIWVPKIIYCSRPRTWYHLFDNCLKFVSLFLRASLRLESIPNHSVDWGVEGLPLSPKYWEHKAVKAEPNDAHHRGPAQPDVAVYLFLDLFGVQITGALIRITQFTACKSNQKMFPHLRTESSFSPSEKSGVINKKQNMNILKKVIKYIANKEIPLKLTLQSIRQTFYNFYSFFYFNL